MPFIAWNKVIESGPSCYSKVMSSRAYNLIAYLLSNTLDFLNIYQINTFVNSTENILELIFYNSSNYAIKLIDDPIIAPDRFLSVRIDYHFSGVLALSFLQ